MTPVVAGVALLTVAAAAVAPVPPPDAAATASAVAPQAAQAVPAHPRLGPPLPAGGAAGATAPRTRGPPRVLLVGDSVALTLAQALPDTGDVEVHNGGVLGCGLLETGRYRYAGDVATTPAECAGTPARWAAAAQQVDADVVAVLVGRWEVMEREVEGRWTAVGDPAYDAELRRRLDAALDAVSATGARPVLLTAPYSRRAERPDGGLWPEDTVERVDRWNALVRETAARRRPPLPVVELGARMAPGGGYVNHVDGVRLRYDGLHVTTAAGAWLAPWLLPQLAAPSS